MPIINIHDKTDETQGHDAEWSCPSDIIFGRFGNPEKMFNEREALQMCIKQTNIRIEDDPEI